MSPIVYYMPLHLVEYAKKHGSEDWLDFAELFKVVNSNASVIDRTGTLVAPFTTEVLYPIPEVDPDVEDFGTLCAQRAQQIVDSGKNITVFYSGGLDSTCVIMALHEELRKRDKYSLMTVASTPEAVRENPIVWAKVIRPHYNLINSIQQLGVLSTSNSTWHVQGENADQLFGSDRVLNTPWLMHAPFNRDNLVRLLGASITRPTALEKFTLAFEELASKSSLPIETMRDFMWWLNFSSKWQSVALRTLAFSSWFNEGRQVSLQVAESFSTFFNTTKFQQLSMSGKLKKWGPVPNQFNYKMAAREYIRQIEPELAEWCDLKQKVGSLYNVIRQRDYTASAIALRGGMLHPTLLDNL